MIKKEHILKKFYYTFSLVLICTLASNLLPIYEKHKYTAPGTMVTINGNKCLFMKLEKQHGNLVHRQFIFNNIGIYWCSCKKLLGGHINSK